ncbi:MAG TPA: hypothetical protein VEK57_25420 [Thermoanaerobaculia bacterium]|nr:hypothetical protein [Thermoanaerobaculia bacterium]
MSSQTAVEVAVTLAGAGSSKCIITPIGSREYPTFVPHKILAAANGPEILTVVADLRHSLESYEPQVFEWLQGSPGNAQEYARDPFGSLKKMGIVLDQETLDHLGRLGELLEQASQDVNRGEG